MGMGRAERGSEKIWSAKFLVACSDANCQHFANIRCCRVFAKCWQLASEQATRNFALHIFSLPLSARPIPIDRLELRPTSRTGKFPGSRANLHTFRMVLPASQGLYLPSWQRSR